MSDGKKAAYEDEEQERWLQREFILKTAKPEMLLQIFDKLKTEMMYLRPQELSLTKLQHARLEQIEKYIRMLP